MTTQTKQQHPHAWEFKSITGSTIVVWGKEPPEGLVGKGRATLKPLYTTPQPTGWEPIDTAPKNGMLIIVWFKTHGAMAVRWTDRDDDPTSQYALWCVDDQKFEPHPVRGYSNGDDTHWMPLPPPPGSAP